MQSYSACFFLCFFWTIFIPAYSPCSTPCFVSNHFRVSHAQSKGRSSSSGSLQFQFDQLQSLASAWARFMSISQHTSAIRWWHLVTTFPFSELNFALPQPSPLLISLAFRITVGTECTHVRVLGYLDDIYTAFIGSIAAIHSDMRDQTQYCHSINHLASLCTWTIWACFQISSDTVRDFINQHLERFSRSKDLLDTSKSRFVI